jgi:hypothetical protein
MIDDDHDHDHDYDDELSETERSICAVIWPVYVVLVIAALAWGFAQW